MALFAARRDRWDEAALMLERVLMLCEHRHDPLGCRRESVAVLFPAR
jgi:hypothetical protein